MTRSRLLGWFGNINAAVGDESACSSTSCWSPPMFVELRRIDVADMLGHAWDAGLVLDPNSARSIIEPDVYADAG